MKRTFIFAMILFALSNFSSAQIKGKEQRLLPIKVDGKWGFIDLTGRIMIQPQFEGAEESSDGILPIKVGKKWGYCNPSGQIIIKPQFDYAGVFAEGLAVIQLEKFFGYTDKEGKIVIRPSFVAAVNFENGIADVMVPQQNDPNPKHSYIDKTGKMITDYHVVQLCSEGMILVREGDKKGFIDMTGKLVIPLEFDEANPFNEGLAIVKIGEYWCCIDKKGEYHFRQKFDYMKDKFYEELVGYKVFGKWGFVNKIAKGIIYPLYDDVGDFSEGLVTFEENKKVGYMDKWGNIVIKPIYALGYKFKDGIARVQLSKDSPEITDSVNSDRAWQLIDKSGKAISGIMYAIAINRFEDGVAWLRDLNKKAILINQSGEYLTDQNFTRVEPWFRDGVAQVFVGKKMGYIDKTGKYIWEPSE